eukprot:GHVN01054999.1.p1 GENE.GHVN01054999.1~~GHVN01054999.1.p1  ORF type:complete len:517 (+),score=98.48 GHVN01054999.1:948-2498(+)
MVVLLGLFVLTPLFGATLQTSSSGRVSFVFQPHKRNRARLRLAPIEQPTKEMDNYDLFVIGGGSGGIAAARRAASLGAKVGIAEFNRWGGTCVNVGCVPKKMMWCASSVGEILRDAHHYGYNTGPNFKPEFSWQHMKTRRDFTVKRLNGIYTNNLKSSGVDYFNEWASLVDKQGKVKVGDKEIVAKHIIIAPGGKPSVLGIPGEEHTINSDDFFSLQNQPKKVAVIGAGYIAVELAGIFGSLGSETHLFFRYDEPIRTFDAMIRQRLVEFMKHDGIVMHGNSTPAGVKKDTGNGKLTLTVKPTVVSETDKDPIDLSEFDAVLIAVGRVPCVTDMGLDKVPSIELRDRSKHIVVDDYQNTGAKGIYALGDVCGKVELTPMAIAAGRRLADRLFGGVSASKADYDLVPTVVFSHPPIGTVGMTEEKARAVHGDDNIKVYSGTSVNLFYSAYDMPPEEKPRTYIKMICAGDDEKVVGLHIIGTPSSCRRAGNLTHMTHDALSNRLTRITHIHLHILFVN